MSVTERNHASSSSTSNQQPSQLLRAPSHLPVQVNQLDSYSLGPSAPTDTGDVASCPGNDPLSHSSTNQETSNNLRTTNSLDSSPTEARQLLRRNTRLTSTFHSPAPEHIPAHAVSSPSDPAHPATVLHQMIPPLPPSSAPENNLSQPAEHDVSVQRGIQAQQPLATSCSASTVKLKRLKSTSDCSAQPPAAMMEMVRPCRRHSKEAINLHHSGSQSSFAVRTSGLPVDESSSIPQKLLDVEVYSLGIFAFKGLAAHRQIAQLMPTTLSERLALFPHVLKRGKAICVTPDNSLLAVATAVLPDVSGLTLTR